MLGSLGPAYWRVVAIAAIFTLARFSEAFLILRGQTIGLSLMMVPMVLVVLNIAYALSAYPIGALPDRMNRIGILILGLLLLVAADLTLASAPRLTGLLSGVVLWGLHMGFTQGLWPPWFPTAPRPRCEERLSGYTTLSTGAALLVASVLAGFLWDAFGAEWTFVAGAVLAILTIMGLISMRRMLAAGDRKTASGTLSP